MPPTGLILSNLGSPTAPDRGEVSAYLRQFLTDRRAIDIAWLPRQLLVRGIIAPFRSARSARAYRKVWTPRGSPLVAHTKDLAAKVGEVLGSDWRVVAGMRTGSPNLETALDELVTAGCRRILVLPLYPQYASATTGSTLEEVWRLASKREVVPEIVPISPFHDHSGFLAAVADRIRPVLSRASGAKLVLSFHGLPERQIRKADPVGNCLKPDCCESGEGVARGCYKAQCTATAKALAALLDLPAGRWIVSYQSRLGRIPWIGPSTAQTLSDMAERGEREVVVATPSFVADCLETLEEVGMGMAEAFEARGGRLHLVPCPNSGEDWAKAVAHMALSYLPTPR